MPGPRVGPAAALLTAGALPFYNEAALAQELTGFPPEAVRLNATVSPRRRAGCHRPGQATLTLGVARAVVERSIGNNLETSQVM
ncbi:MAG TPA: hypothetical protein VKE74_17495 [Gemmataceae bacterium]|nr:hypothetical protein [Gemmataceae bacterium]